ncbi:hypothetical protein D9M69_601600 [compost metagenome]
MRYPEHVGIHGHCRLIMDHRSNHICCFPPYPRHFHQLFYGIRHLIVKIIHQHLCHSYQVLRFIVGIGNAPDIFENLLRLSFGKDAGIGVALKEFRRHHIYPLIGTLRRKNNGY